MKKLFIFLVFVLIVKAGTAQTNILLPVKIHGLWGFIDMKGAMIIPPEYESVDPFQKGDKITKAVKNGKLLVINNINETIDRIEYEDLAVLGDSAIAVKKNNLWGIYLLNGKEILPIVYKKINRITAYKYFYITNENGSGLADVNGKIILEAKYDTITISADGFFTKKNKKCGFTAPNGKEMLEPVYDSIFLAGGNTFFFESNGKWGAINDKKDTMLKPVWESPGRIANYFVKIQKDSGMWVYATSTGSMLPCEEDDGFKELNNKYLVVNNGENMKLMDASGKVIVPPGPYKHIDLFDSTFFEVEKNGLVGLFNTNGQPVGELCYTQIEAFANNVALARKEKGWGLINSKGITIIPCHYENIELYYGRARAKDNTGLHVYEFDDDGNLTDKANYRNVLTISVQSRSEDPYKKNRVRPLANTSSIAVQISKKTSSRWYCENKKYGLKDSLGKIYIRPVFSYINQIGQTPYYLCAMKASVYCNVGGIVIPFQYVYAIVNESDFKTIIPPNYLMIDTATFNTKECKFLRVLCKDGSFELLQKNGMTDHVKYTFIDAYASGHTRCYKKGKMILKYLDGDRMRPTADGFLSMIEMHYLHNSENYNTNQWWNTRWRLEEEKGTWCYLNDEGDIRLHTKYAYANKYEHGAAIVVNDKKYGVIDEEGKEIIPLAYLNITRLEGSNGALFKLTADNPKYGFIDGKGEIMTEIKYDRLGPYHEGKAWALKNKKYGYIDQDFHILGDTGFNNARDFNEGMAAVRKGYRWGFVDNDIHLKIPCIYYNAGNFHNGLAWAVNSKGSYGYIGYDGKWVIDPVYIRASDFADNGLAVVKDDKSEMLIDKTGKIILSHFLSISPYSNGVAIGKKGNRYILINAAGKPYCTLRRYSSIYDFHEGYARVVHEDKYGFIDATGAEVVKPAYYYCTDVKEGKSLVGYERDRHVLSFPDLGMSRYTNKVCAFSEGMAMVRQNDTSYTFVSEAGNSTMNKTFQAARSFQNGLARVRISGNWAMIDKNGMVVVSPKYNDISEFSEDRAIVKLTGFYGVADLKGSFIVPPDYEYIKLLPENVFKLEHGNEVGYLKTDGSWLWKMGE